MKHKRGRTSPSPSPHRVAVDPGGPVAIAYRGDAAFAFVLADCLEREGCVVEWDRPVQGEAGWGDSTQVDVALAAVAAVGLPLAEAVSAGVARFRRRFPDRGTVRIVTVHP